MAVTPNTNIRLLKCNLNLDEFNQLNFASKNAQYNYFNGLQKLDISGATYQRHNNVIRYAAHIDTILEYNYVMYQNNNYSDKWFYAYITRMEYVNDNMTNIYIKTDPYQTWQFDLTFMRSFVEREHVDNDTVGLHTIDEELSLGDFLQVSAPSDINSLSSSDVAVCVSVTELPSGVSLGDSKQHTINGIYSGLINCIFSHSEGLSKIAEEVNYFISKYDSAAKANAISSIYMIPKAFFLATGSMDLIVYESGHSFYLPTNINRYCNITNDVTVSAPTTLAESYSPHNNKLKCFPYSYLLVSNNAGGDVVFHYEDFTNNTPKFKVIGALTPGCSIKCIPLNYLKQTDNNTYKSFNYGIVGAKLPICPWVNDTYTNWLSENGIPIAVRVGVGLAQIGVGIATGGIGLAVGAVSGAATVAGAMTENYAASKAPDQANGDVAAGDITFSAGKSVFTAYKMSIRSERAKVIDSYFDMYGYKVNTLKVPNVTGRTNWNYVKTINANIEAYIPQEDLDEIKRMFDNGVTIWHNPSTFLDYSQNNGII